MDIKHSSQLGERREDKNNLLAEKNKHDCKTFRVVLTGGPGGGKSTAGDLLRREFGRRVAFVPEAATLLFSGGFPRYNDPNCIIYQQKAIYHVQQNLEDVQAAHFCNRAVLLW
jgi:hypothetical protein